jgi:hypothetical protein
VRSTAPLTTSTIDQTTPVFTPIALSGGMWTQGATELEQLLGQVRFSVPARSDCDTMPGGFENPALATVRIKLDGQPIGTAFAATNGAAHTETTDVQWGTVASYTGGPIIPPVANGTSITSIFEPGSDTSRGLTADVGDTCGVSGGAATAHFTVESVLVDVVGVR